VSGARIAAGHALLDESQEQKEQTVLKTSRIKEWSDVTRSPKIIMGFHGSLGACNASWEVES